MVEPVIQAFRACINAKEIDAAPDAEFDRLDRMRRWLEEKGKAEGEGG